MRDSLGDYYDPLGIHLEDPYPFYTRARREKPIFFSSALDAWVVTRLADVRKVLRDGKTYGSSNALRPFSPLSPGVFEELAKGYPECPLFITMDGEPHRRRRTQAAAGFSAERVEAATPYITERAEGLIPELADAGPADFMAGYANRLPVDVICHLMGFAESDFTMIGDDTRRAAALPIGHRFQSEEEEIEAARSWVRVQGLMGRYVTDRRAEPRDDIMSELVRAYAADGRSLTPDQEAELVAIIFGVTLPGHITTSALLGNGLLRLLSNPGQWRLLCERPDLIPNAVEEIARYDTPTHIFLRQATQDTVLAGQPLAAGTEVAVWLAAANRDETAFEKAEEFDITRPVQSKHVVFGLGAHFCLGAALARRQIEISLRLLTERLPGLQLVPDQRIDFRPSLDHRGPMSLLVQL